LDSPLGRSAHVTSDYVSTHPTYIAVADETIVGFCALQIHSEEALLDHLWVLPTAMGAELVGHFLRMPRRSRENAVLCA
jgi:hypothetical protein